MHPFAFVGSRQPMNLPDPISFFKSLYADTA